MKKTIVAILIMAIAAMSCFATDLEGVANTQKVKLNGSVSEKDLTPVISLKGSETEAGTYDQEITFSDLGNGGTAYFKIIDNTSVNLTAAKSVDVTVSVDQWASTESADTRAITLSNPVANAALTSEAVKTNGVAATFADPKLTLTYAVNKYFDNVNKEVATFTATWESDSEARSVLSAATYTANVWIAVSIVR